MRAINHAVTGAIIGLSIHQPAIALPVAFLSHFVLDVIPHSGIELKTHKTAFNIALALDTAACILLVFLLYVIYPKGWLIASIAAFLAASPDLLKINEWLVTLKGKKFKKSPLANLLSKIQWSETYWGFAVETFWLAASALLLAKMI